MKVPLEITDFERDSQLQRKIDAYLTAHLNSARRDNDKLSNKDSDTWALRGRIKFIKLMLKDMSPNPSATDVDDDA